MDKNRESKAGSKATSKALSLKSMNELMEQTNDSTKSLPTASTNATNLRELNEYCLLEVFSVESLDLMDLCSIAETCERFRSIVQRIVKKIIVCEGYNGAGNFKVKFRAASHIIEEDFVQRIFTNFGSGLSAVNVDRHYHSNSAESFLLSLLMNYCNSDNLKSLSVHNIRLPKAITRATRKFFDAKLFAKLDLLVQLSVQYVRNDDAILENIFPKLERFEYANTERETEEPTMEVLSTFISRHTSLKRICLKLSVGDWCTNIFQAIGNSCKELEELHLKATSWIGSNRTLYAASLLVPLQTLQRLTVLRIFETARFADFNLFSSMPELRELHLLHCVLPNDRRQFDHLSQITKLYLWGYSSYFHNLTDIVRRLTKLELLDLEQDFVERETILEIFGIVKGRPNVLTLACYFKRFKVKKSNDIQKVILRQAGAKIMGYGGMVARSRCYL